MITGRQMAPVRNKELRHQLSWHPPNYLMFIGEVPLIWLCLAVHAGFFKQARAAPRGGTSEFKPAFKAQRHSSSEKCKLKP